MDTNTPKRNKMLPESKELEDGEISNASSPLKKFDSAKQATLDGNKIQDSLKKRRQRKMPKYSDSDSDSSDDSDVDRNSDCEERPFLLGSSSSSAPSVSIMADGLLDNRTFTTKFSSSDRRDLKALKQWANSLKTLISDVVHQGGSKYKKFVDEIRDAQELLETLLEDKWAKEIRRNLKRIKSFFDMAHKLLNIHEQASGVGNTMYSLIQSQEFKLIFGKFETELISQSHKIGEL